MNKWSIWEQCIVVVTSLSWVALGLWAVLSKPQPQKPVVVIEPLNLRKALSDETSQVR